MHTKSFGSKTRPHELRHVAIFPWKQFGTALHDADLHPQSRQGLSELATDRSAPEHDHAFRSFFELIENCFVGEIANFVDALDFRNDRAAAGRDHKIFGAELLAIHLNLVRRKESRLAAKDVHA